VVFYQSEIGLTEEQRNILLAEIHKAEGRFTDLQQRLQKETEALAAFLKKEQVEEQKEPWPDSRDYLAKRLRDVREMLEADVRMTVSDYANAIKLYARIVDIAPQVAGYHVRLAIAMASYPATSKKAEREFLEALRLDPDNADIHYQFGLYYKVMRQRARALGEMQTAVRLNPRHRAAREELEALSPRDSALKSLKKLFR
jgi:tetratricopeptide (TPR) repeat protein